MTLRGSAYVTNKPNSVNKPLFFLLSQVFVETSSRSPISSIHSYIMISFIKDWYRCYLGMYMTSFEIVVVFLYEHWYTFLDRSSDFRMFEIQVEWQLIVLIIHFSKNISRTKHVFKKSVHDGMATNKVGSSLELGVEKQADYSKKKLKPKDVLIGLLAGYVVGILVMMIIHFLISKTCTNCTSGSGYGSGKSVFILKRKNQFH